MADLAELKSDLDKLNEKMDKNTEITRIGFETMNGRVKKLELKQAFTEGQQSPSLATNGSEDWKKATFKLIGVIAAIVALASTAAAVVAKVVLQ